VQKVNKHVFIIIIIIQTPSLFHILLCCSLTKLFK